MSLLIAGAGVQLLSWLWDGGPVRRSRDLASPVAPAPSPRLVNGTFELELQSRAFLVAYISQDGQIEVLVEKGGKERLPLASLTKLVTGLTALTYYSPDEKVVVRPEHLRPEYEGPPFLRAGDTFRVEELMYPLLISSSNAAAAALASYADGAGDGEFAEFVRRMNAVAAAAGLTDSHFYNPSGLDPPEGGGVNYSTAYDLLRLAKFLLTERPEIFAVSRLPNYEFTAVEGRAGEYLAVNTNELLLGSWPWPAAVGSKTGQTDLAGKNMLLVLGDLASGGRVVAVVLGADNHFEAMSRLLDWLYQSYEFGGVIISFARTFYERQMDSDDVPDRPAAAR